MPSAAPSAGQWLFLRVEALFNRLFGDRLNPLYHLGAIAYFQLWIVVATGLYLYAFFDTSVDGARASVDSITHGQRWAGGVLRSLHRYASDGLVLAMVLHLTRHLAFGRHRGFRWFSWVSGVVLLWTVYIAGINGYMLPWDRVSQFTVTATTEWLDAIPIFNGALARNFLDGASVNDRLFSLLVFVHIGVPLATLAVLWIHTQRVPRAETQPPRPLAAGLLVSLLVLSLAHPAVSQGEVDFATAPIAIGIDWFYLPVYPLIYVWSANAVWALVAGVTGLLVLLPWLPPGRAGERAFAVAVQPDDRILTARRGETLLEAGLREGLPMPYDCRNGGCGVCKATLAFGEVSYGAYQESALSDAERAGGRILLCCAQALSDLEIAYVPLAGAAPAPVRQYRGRVVALEPLSHDVMRIAVRVEDGGRLRFHAGQYINVLLDDGAKRSFSFATAPRDSDEFELQVRLIPGGRFTTQVFTSMKVGELLRFEGPLGSFTLREDGVKPIIFVAGATGFAPVKSMLEHAFATGFKRQMKLYWGVRARRDLYLGELAWRWAKEHDNFSFIPVLSAAEPGDEWTGRTGLVHEAIFADYPDLAGHQVYACGSVQMVEAIHPELRAHGLSQDDCFSDAFHLAPRLRGEDAEVVRLGGARA